MESKATPAAAARVYKDFEPSMEWVPEDDSDTLIVYLPGFAKEQLRVQLKSRNLIISGERKLQENNTWTRFRVEFPVSANCDLTKITAKFEGSILYVRQPKVITPTAKPAAQEEIKPLQPVVAPVPTPQKPVEQDQKPKTEELKEKIDQDVPKKEEKMAKTTDHEAGKVGDVKSTEGVRENASENENINKDELDRTSKRALDKYKQVAGAFGRKLKTSSNAVNAIVILFVGLLIGIIFSSSIKSWNKP